MAMPLQSFALYPIFIHTTHFGRSNYLLRVQNMYKIKISFCFFYLNMLNELRTFVSNFRSFPTFSKFLLQKSHSTTQLILIRSGHTRFFSFFRYLENQPLFFDQRSRLGQYARHFLSSIFSCAVTDSNTCLQFFISRKSEKLIFSPSIFFFSLSLLVGEFSNFCAHFSLISYVFQAFYADESFPSSTVMNSHKFSSADMNSFLFHDY